MDLKGDNVGVQPKRTNVRSLSQLTFNRETKPPVDGLRKLASHYKNSFKNNKLDLERFRNNFKDKRPIIDPRFRRERPKSPKKSLHSQSDCIFSALTTPKHIISQSTPSLMNKLPAQSQTSDTQTDKFKSEQGNSSIGKVKSHKSTEPEPTETSSLVKFDTANEEQEVVEKQNTGTSYRMTGEGDVDTKSAVSHSTNSKRNYQWGPNQVDLNCLNKSPYWDDPRLIRKYANLLSTGGVKKTKSSVTLPFSVKKFPEGVCMCVKCSCLKAASYDFDGTTELDGSISMAMQRQTILKERFTVYYMWIFYAIGCFFGLSIVALFAWILSNDVLWALVNYTKEPEKRNFTRTVFNYLGGSMLMAVNFVFGGLYNVFVLPRNAVFSGGEEDSPWISVG